MKVSDCMTPCIEIASPDETIAQAARRMQGSETGFLPVVENDRVVGVMTDRDIVVRAVAEEKDADTPVSAVMTAKVLQCSEDDDLDDAATIMSDNQIRRLVVLSADGRLAGILSLGDISQMTSDQDGLLAAQALTGITEPGGKNAH